MVKFAAIEGGGTSWRVALVDDDPTNLDAVESAQFITTENPQEVMGEIKNWLRNKTYDALGIATFGPIDAKLGSPTYGQITSTPKPGWTNTEVVGFFWDGKTPMLFDTDVNAPALAEFKYGNPPGTTSCAYITVGTGIGVGLVVNGQPVHGMMHPEAGHVNFRRANGATFKGACPFHGDCVEGIAATPGIAGAKGIPKENLAQLTDDDPVWDEVALALGSLCLNLVLVASPERIVISGGVMNRTVLYAKTRAVFKDLLKDYIKDPLLGKNIDQFIVPSTFGQKAGVVGTLTLAKVAYENAQKATGSSASSLSKEKASSACCAGTKPSVDQVIKKMSPIAIGAAFGALAVIGLSHFMKCPAKK